MKRLAADATKGGYQLKVADPQAAEIAEELERRLKINHRIDDWARLSFRDGESLIELGVNEALEVVTAVRKKTLMMHRNSDESDQFPDPMHAYWYSEHMHAVRPSRNTKWFADWQIVHARWEHDEGNKYGWPMMSEGRGSFKKFTQGEKDVAVRRYSRAAMRYHHVIDGDASDIRRYKEENKVPLNNPDVARADFFSNKQGGITAISGDGTIGNIEDIVHHIETWAIGSPVPLSLMGYGQNLNRDVLNKQKEQYDEGLPVVQDWIANQLISPILELQWLLNGRLPEGLGYEIAWETKRVSTPDDILKIAQAAQALRGLGLPEEAIVIVMARFLPGVSPDMIKLAAVGNTADAARLARIDADLGASLSR
jgi:hypothetical protein